MKRSRRFPSNWSPAKDGLYWREWTKVCAAARPELDRHEFHVEIFGKDKSHLDFSDGDFDAFLGGCKAIYDPGNLQAQLDALNGRKKRLLFGINRAAAKLGKNLSYVDGIVEQMDKDGRLASGPDEDDERDEWQREMARVKRPKRKLLDLNEIELEKVRIALEPGRKKKLKKKPQPVAASLCEAPF